MKCPKCSSQMFVAEETVTDKSHVAFYRCSLCVGEHVSAAPVIESPSEPLGQRTGEFVAQSAARMQYAI